MSQKFKILLYYKYTRVSEPESVRSLQKELCENLDLKGRIIISTEGINGTVAGFPKDIDVYMTETGNIKEFSGIDWKISYSHQQVFPKLRIVVRDEIVTLGITTKGKYIQISKKTDYIEPDELMNLYDMKRDFVIIDTRNLYESYIGKFKNALISPIKNFREFSKFAETLEKYKKKEVITYCTGGIRCEKASAYLRSKGFKKVRQLRGGIHQYGEKVGGKYFEGKMFVFDKRLHTPVNVVNPTIISACHYCLKSITRYIDCSVKSCHSLFICCKVCQSKNFGTCSPKCLNDLKVLKLAAYTQPPHSNQFL